MTDEAPRRVRPDPKKIDVVEYPLTDKNLQDLQYAMYSAYHRGVPKLGYTEAGNGSDFTFDRTKITAEKTDELVRPKGKDFNTKMTAITLPIPYDDFAATESRDIGMYENFGGRVERGQDNHITIVMPDHQIRDFIQTQIRREKEKVPDQHHHYSENESQELIRNAVAVDEGSRITVRTAVNYTLQGGAHDGKAMRRQGDIHPASVSLFYDRNVIPKLDDTVKTFGIDSGRKHTAKDSSMQEIVEAAAEVVAQAPSRDRRVTPAGSVMQDSTPDKIIRDAKATLGISPADAIIDKQFTTALRGRLEVLQAKQVHRDISNLQRTSDPMIDNQGIPNLDGYTSTFYQTKLSPTHEQQLHTRAFDVLTSHPAVKKYMEIYNNPGKRAEIAPPSPETESATRAASAETGHSSDAIPKDVKRLAAAATNENGPEKTRIAYTGEATDPQNISPDARGSGRGIA